jgi:hypothetical protein
MSYKSDVKPVVLTTDGVAFTGRTRLRGLMVQSTGSSGSAIINTLVSGATTAASTTTGVYLKVQVGAGGTETLNLPEDGVLYADGIGSTAISNVTVTLFIDK